MKKKYIEPTIKVHSVKLHSMLAGSLGEGGGDTVTGTVDPTTEGDGGLDVLGKEDFDW